MNITVALYSAILFFILSPNVLLRLPSNGSKFIVSAVHAAIFGVIIYFTQHYVWKLSVGQQEGMTAKSCHHMATAYGGDVAMNHKYNKATGECYVLNKDGTHKSLPFQTIGTP